MSMLRRVRIFHMVETTGANSGTPRANLKWERQHKTSGWFHQWGNNFEEFEHGPGNYTVAIVEHDNGTVDTYPPNLIEFVEQP